MLGSRFATAVTAALVGDVGDDGMGGGAEPAGLFLQRIGIAVDQKVRQPS